jgi:anti-anti-sigma factor
MDVRAARVGSGVVIDLEGRFTLEVDTRPLHDLVRSIVHVGSCRVVLDFGSVPALDCSGIGELVTLYNLVRQAGGTLALANVARHQTYLLQILGLLKVFRTFASRREAMAWCRSIVPQQAVGFPFEPLEALSRAGRPSIGGILGDSVQVRARR